MISQFVFFVTIAAVCFSGLLFTLWTLGKPKQCLRFLWIPDPSRIAQGSPVAHEQWTFKSIGWLMVQIWFGNTSLSFGQASSFHPLFGPILMTIFAALSNTLLLTSKITLKLGRYRFAHFILFQFWFLSFQTLSQELIPSVLSYLDFSFLFWNALSMFSAERNARGLSWLSVESPITHLSYLQYLFQYTITTIEGYEYFLVVSSPQLITSTGSSPMHCFPTNLLSTYLHLSFWSPHLGSSPLALSIPSMFSSSKWPAYHNSSLSVSTKGTGLPEEVCVNPVKMQPNHFSTVFRNT